MSVQLLRQKIKDLVDSIEDEDTLQACYVAILAIAKLNNKQPKSLSSLNLNQITVPVLDVEQAIAAVAYFIIKCSFIYKKPYFCKEY